MSSMVRPWVAVGEIVGNGQQVEIGGVLGVRQLRPAHRGAHGCARPRSQAPRAGDRSIPVVLVEIQEHALAALLLPPVGGYATVAALELSSEADRGVPNVLEWPVGADPKVDVNAPVSAGLGVGPQPKFVQELLGDRCDPLGIGERGSRLWIQVEPQFVGMIQVRSPNRPWMERERAHLRRPDQCRRLGRAQLVGGSPAREGDLGGLDPVRRSFWQALLVEAVAVIAVAGGESHPLPVAVRPPFQGGGTFPDCSDHGIADGREVIADLQLGDRRSPRGGFVDDPVGAGDANCPLADLDVQLLRPILKG